MAQRPDPLRAFTGSGCGYARLRNVVVVVQESLKTTEQVIVLEDSEGEFLQCEPTYKDPPRRVRLVEDPQVIDDLREQLEAAEQTLATARRRDVEQAQGLQEALRSQAAELREAHQAEVTAWKQQLDAEKERARKRWKTNCEHLAEQDAIIAAHEEEIATLQEQVRELRTRAPGGHTEPLSPPADTGFLPPEERRPPCRNARAI